jgi:NADH-quinone oxidoreductase subunit H
MTNLLSVTQWSSSYDSLLDFSDSFALGVSLKVGLVIVLALTLPLLIGYMEHKVMAHQQGRVGPMEAGPHGTLQLVADGIKFVQKEDIIPAAADKRVFALAPGLALVPGMLVFFVLPLGPGLWAQDLELGLFYALAIGSIGTLGILMGGWASANKFSLFGAIRGAAQLIAYELPLLLAAAAVALQAETLSMVEIVEAQSTSILIPGTGIGMWYVFPQALGFVIFFIAAMAELNRPPFDMPIADSELVFGFMTEYSGIKFAMYLLTEYGGMVSMSGIITVLYLGGWELLPGLGTPGCEGMFDCTWWGVLIGLGVTFAKITALAFVMVWTRVAWPRLREDQLQKFSWLVLIPLSLLNILIVAIGKVVF